MFKRISALVITAALCLGGGSSIAAANTQPVPLPSSIAAVEADLEQSPSPITKVAIDGSTVTMDIQGGASRSAVFNNVSKTDIAQIKHLAKANGINVDEHSDNVFLEIIFLASYILVALCCVFYAGVC